MPQTDYPAVSKEPIAPTDKAPEVLIVEKEKLLRLMMAKLLQVSGYKVYTCGDSHRGLELIEKRSLDLVITDLVMTGASGMDVLRAARRYQPRAKVIIITETPSSHTLLEAKLEGAYAYLRKPLQLRQFLLILKDAIEHTKLLNGYQYQEGDGGVISEDIEHRVKNFEFAPSPAALVGRASVPAKSNFCGSGFPAATS